MLAESFLRSGKVRDLHMLNDRRLMLVASDRISAFDVVLPSMIPDKGRILTGLSRFWFAETAGIVPNHLLDTDPMVFADYVADDIRSKGYRSADVGPLDALRGRMMICRPAFVVPIEAVVRGYLAGSGWKEYQASGTVCGIALPAGLRESDRLPEPIFTPATKAEAGEHDENISFDRMIEHIGTEVLGASGLAGRLAEAIRDRALRLYGFASAVAEDRGILLADTKFEFGLAQAWGPGSTGSYSFHDDDPADPLDQLILIDEALTPDSSRFWDAATYAPGRSQASFDKQFVRDWLETQPWDKTPPGPDLPADVVEGTRTRYVEAFERITGASFARYLEEDVIGRMTSFRFAVNVTPKPGILDPAGRAVEGSLGHLGLEGIHDVRIGRRAELTVEADDETAARAAVERLAAELLSNPLIEIYAIEPTAAASSAASVGTGEG